MDKENNTNLELLAQVAETTPMEESPVAPSRKSGRVALKKTQMDESEDSSDDDVVVQEQPNKKPRKTATATRSIPSNNVSNQTKIQLQQTIKTYQKKVSTLGREIDKADTIIQELQKDIQELKYEKKQLEANTKQLKKIHKAETDSFKLKIKQYEIPTWLGR